MTKKKKKRLVPKHIRNKHAKDIRRELKNSGIKVSAKQIYYL